MTGLVMTGFLALLWLALTLALLAGLLVRLVRHQVRQGQRQTNLVVRFGRALGAAEKALQAQLDTHTHPALPALAHSHPEYATVEALGEGLRSHAHAAAYAPLEHAHADRAGNGMTHVHHFTRRTPGEGDPRVRVCQAGACDAKLLIED